MAETRRRLADAAPKSVADIRALGRPVVAFSERMAETDRTVKTFLYERMYEHWHLNRSHSKARRVVMRPVRPAVRRAQLPAAAVARARRGRPNAPPAPASSPTTSPA